ncbi:hypothetical protein FHR53_002290 [Xanthomonas arboricola]
MPRLFCARFVPVLAARQAQRPNLKQTHPARGEPCSTLQIG